jgi:hypothetical protein
MEPYNSEEKEIGGRGSGGAVSVRSGGALSVLERNTAVLKSDPRNKGHSERAQISNETTFCTFKWIVRF